MQDFCIFAVVSFRQRVHNYTLCTTILFANTCCTRELWIYLSAGQSAHLSLLVMVVGRFWSLISRKDWTHGWGIAAQYTGTWQERYAVIHNRQFTKASYPKCMSVKARGYPHDTGWTGKHHPYCAAAGYEAPDVCGSRDTHWFAMPPLADSRVGPLNKTFTQIVHFAILLFWCWSNISQT